LPKLPAQFIKMMGPLLGAGLPIAGSRDEAAPPTSAQANPAAPPFTASRLDTVNAVVSLCLSMFTILGRLFQI
jgi:hypothetical protein